MDEMNNNQNAVVYTQQPNDGRGTLYIDPSVANILPSMVKESLASMPAAKQQQFMEEYNRKKKSTGLAYFFLLLCLGMPYGYLGKWGLQIAYWLTGCGLCLWGIYLLFALPGVVKDTNRDIATQIVRDLKMMS